LSNKNEELEIKVLDLTSKASRHDVLLKLLKFLDSLVILNSKLVKNPSTNNVCVEKLEANNISDDEVKFTSFN